MAQRSRYASLKNTDKCYLQKFNTSIGYIFDIPIHLHPSRHRSCANLKNVAVGPSRYLGQHKSCLKNGAVYSVGTKVCPKTGQFTQLAGWKARFCPKLWDPAPNFRTSAPVSWTCPVEISIKPATFFQTRSCAAQAFVSPLQKICRQRALRITDAMNQECFRCLAASETLVILLQIIVIVF